MDLHAEALDRDAALGGPERVGDGETRTEGGSAVDTGVGRIAVAPRALRHVHLELPGPVLDVAADAFAQLQGVKELETSAGKPYAVFDLCDLSGKVSGKIWSEATDALETAKAARPGSFVKVRGRTQLYRGNLQMIVSQMRVVDQHDAPEGFDPDQLVDPALAAVEDLVCRTLVFDIETVPALDRRELARVYNALLRAGHDEESARRGLEPYRGDLDSPDAQRALRDGMNDDFP